MSASRKTSIPVARSVELAGQSAAASAFIPAFDFDPAQVGSAYGSNRSDRAALVFEMERHCEELRADLARVEVEPAPEAARIAAKKAGVR